MTSSNIERAQAASAVILDALAAGLSHADAGALAGVGPKAVQRRLLDATFAAEVARRRAARVEEITGQLTALGARAVTVISDLLDAENSTVRLRAAEAALTWLTRLRREVDFDTRLARLERDAVNEPTREDISDDDA